jgi:DNA-binding MarR family transcriptional regulator
MNIILEPNEPLSDQAFHRLLAITRIARQHARQLSSEQGLQPREQSVLHYLLENDDVTIGRLQQYLHKSPSTTSVLVAKLEDAGFVSRTRSPEDNRVVIVALTAQGRSLAQQTPLAGFPLLRRQLAALPETRQAEMNDVLAEILTLIEGQNES